ncbi:MAG: WG repeat-containing protein [Bacteroidetes bacterium]|nr:WG repeat-containing protein [Bacteroidota bacterium]
MRKILTIIAMLTLVACNQKKKEISLKLIPVKQGEYWGYVDKDGKFIINPQFKQAFTFTDDIALIQNTEGKFGFIDATGKIVVTAAYKDATGFSDGLAAVVKENQKIEYIDKTGKTVLNLDANIETAEAFVDGIALVELNGKKSYIDKTGKVTIANQFDNSYRFSNGLALIRQKVKEDYKYGYIDKTGKIVINPQFDDASFFNEDMAAIKVDKKYGFIDKTGKIVITPQFDDYSGFSNGLAAVKQGELWGFINKQGKFEINPQYKYVQDFNDEGLCPVRSTTNDKWGFITKDGKVKIEPQFESVSNFYDEISLTQLNKKWGVINKEGKYLTNPIYDEIRLSPMPFYPSYVQSDYFDISSISSMLFKDITNSSFRGYQKDFTFTKLQTKFPKLTHDNYSNYKDFESESNISLELASIDFLFNKGFTDYKAKYKKELKYNYYSGGTYYDDVYDGVTTTYDDNIPLRAAIYNFKLINKAKSKSADIMKELKSKLPQNFKVETPDDNTFILDGTDYSLAIIKKTDDDAIHLILAFEKATLDPLRKSNSNSSSATVDSTKKM